MIPRSVPEMAKRPMVSFGLSGPVTQPTSDVPAGAAGAGGGAAAASGTGCAAFGGNWLAVPAGLGAGTTAACCCTRAECGTNALRTGPSSCPSFGSGARAFAPGGRCPVGRPPVEGKAGVAVAFAGAWAAAAAPVQGSAVAGGATPIATLSPIAAASATGIDAIRARGDISQQLTNVTIVMVGIVVISDPLIGMHP